MEGTKPAEIISGVAPVLFTSVCLLSAGKETEARRLLECSAEMLLDAAVGLRSHPNATIRSAGDGSDVFSCLGAGPPHLTKGFSELVAFRSRLVKLGQIEGTARGELTEILELATQLTAKLGQAVRDSKGSRLK